MDRKRIVILGAGFGGLLTALQISKKEKNAQIILIDKRSEHVYAPWLYELCTGFLFHSTKKQVDSLRGTGAIDLKLIIKKSRRKNIKFRHAEVSGCDFSTKHVLLSDGKTVKYDTLVIALGSETTYYGIEGLKQNSLHLKSVEDALKIRQKLESLVNSGKEKHILIVGAGPTGVECASELANYKNKLEDKGVIKSNKLSITLIDASDSILPQQPQLQRYAAKRLKKLGVKTMINTTLSRVDKKKAYIKNAKEILFDELIWAGGVSSCAALKNFNLPKDPRGRVKTSSTLQIDGHPDIYAIGDNISLIDQTSQRAVPANAWSAIDQSKVLTHNLHCKSCKKNYKLPKSFPAIVTVGGRCAVATVYGVPLWNGLAIFLRRLVDLRYFLKILPLFTALAYWRRSILIIGKND